MKALKSIFAIAVFFVIVMGSAQVLKSDETIPECKTRAGAQWWYTALCDLHTVTADQYRAACCQGRPTPCDLPC